MVFATTVFFFLYVAIATGTHAVSADCAAFVCIYATSRGSNIFSHMRGSNLMRCCRCFAAAVALGALLRAASLQFMSVEKSSVLEHVFSLPSSFFCLSGFLSLCSIFAIACRYDLFYCSLFFWCNFTTLFYFFTLSFYNSFHWSRVFCYKFWVKHISSVHYSLFV